MSNNYWNKIYENVSAEAEKAKEKSKEGKIISSYEAATIREKKLYDRMEKDRKKENEDTLSKRWEEAEGEEKTPVRAAALHTIAKVSKYEDLNALDVQGAEEKFLKLTRDLWTELAVHKNPDLDANACLKVMELAIIQGKKINEVEKGETATNGVIMDTSEKDGVIAEDGGRKLIIDHHGPESDRTTSATKFVYEMLTELGLLKKDKRLDRFVDFVTECDNLNFKTGIEKVFPNYHKNLYGLSPKMKVDDVLELFKKSIKFDPSANLPDEYLATHKYFNPQSKEEKPLIEFSEHLERQMKFGKEALENLEKAGYVVDTGEDNFGKILIDTKKKNGHKGYYNRIDGDNNSNQLEVFSRGYGGYLVWSPMENCFVLFTKKKMDRKFFSQGFKMRGCMWMLPKENDGKKMTITLEEIFSKLTGKKFEIIGNLKKLLDKDLMAKQLLSLLDEGKLTEKAIRKAAIEANVPLRMLLKEMLMQNWLINGKYIKKISAVPMDKKKTTDANEIAIKLILDHQTKRMNNGGSDNGVDEKSQEI